MAPHKDEGGGRKMAPPETWGPKAQRDGALRQRKVHRGPEAQPGGGGRGIRRGGLRAGGDAPGGVRSRAAGLEPQRGKARGEGRCGWVSSRGAEPGSGCAPTPPSESRCSAPGAAVMQAPGPGLSRQQPHFLLLKVPRILGMNLPTLLSLVSSSAGASPAPGPPASSFLQKTSNLL